MNFGHAVEAMKQGECVSRAGWNGRAMHLFLASGATTPGRVGATITLSNIPKGPATGLPLQDTICMLTTQNTVCVGWLASQSDMLAEDWVVLP